MTKTEKAKATKKRLAKKLKIVDHPRSSATDFTNREIGWLNFNRRVLCEAEDLRNPLFERLKFLTICNSNLDEFFMKRVGGLKRQVAFGISSKSSDGKTPIQLLKEIRTFVLPMIKDQSNCYSKILRPELKKNGIFLLKWSELNVKEKEAAQKYYLKNVFPVLTPLSVDPGHPFPFISNLSTSLGVTLKNPDTEEKFFARVKIPQVLPQWVRINPENPFSYRFISMVEMIMQNLNDLFPLMQVLDVMPFRLTRNADITRDEEDAEDLLEMIEEELKLRRFAEVVRLEHGPNPDPWMIKFLMEELELLEEDIYELPELLDYTGLGIITELDMPKFKFEQFTSSVPQIFNDEDPTQIFNILKNGDQLVHHPYESFTATTERFIRTAAEDPKVLAIKMTLYRTGDKSPFIRALIKAAEMGKQVVCLVELKARFDEERNIYWAQELENAGVHVVYGIVGLKTHAKTTLVVRQEPEGLKCYAHIGTGNYNTATARFYTDLGLLTANEEITSELVEFFHYLTGRSLKTNYKKLLIAPINMSQKFLSLIEREAEHAQAGRPSLIVAKMNNMEENDIVLHLYSASQKGVDVNLIVRGFCCVRPGVKGLSDRVTVMSVIGRFLEHSRIFYFRNGAADPVDGDFFIGSADWMYRNLHARVECITPILDRKIKERLWDILQTYAKDQRQTWDMQSDGSYKQRRGSLVGIHKQFMNMSHKDSPSSDRGDNGEDNSENNQS